MVDKVVVDTSFLIELLDRGRRELVEYIVDKEVLIPLVVLYEYLYGYRSLVGMCRGGRGYWKVWEP